MQGAKLSVGTPPTPARSIAAVAMEPQQHGQPPAEQGNSSAAVSGPLPRPCCLPCTAACITSASPGDPRRSCRDLLTPPPPLPPAGGVASPPPTPAAGAAAASAAAGAGTAWTRGGHCSGPAQPEPRSLCGRPTQCGGWLVPGGERACRAGSAPRFYPASHLSCTSLAASPAPARPQVHFYCKEGFDALEAGLRQEHPSLTPDELSAYREVRAS